MVSSPVQASEAPERVNSIGRVVGAIFNPKTTFESIARRPTWLVPMILSALISLGIVSLYGHRAGWQGYFEKQDANSSSFQQASPQQQQQAIERQVKYGPPFVYGIAAIATAIAAVVVAAVLWGVFNGLSGTKLNFKTSLGIVTYSWMPGIILGLLSVLIIFLKDPSTLDLQNLVASNGGAFLSSDSPKWMIALFGSFDLFSFWYMILMAIGFSAAAPKKLSFGKAFIWILSSWLLYVLVKVGLTAAFS